MTIQTKLDCGDECWFMENNRPKSDVIMKIHTTHVYDQHYINTESNVFYFIGKSMKELPESLVFESKEKLLQSL